MGHFVLHTQLQLRIEYTCFAYTSWILGVVPCANALTFVLSSLSSFFHSDIPLLIIFGVGIFPLLCHCYIALMFIMHLSLSSSFCNRPLYISFEFHYPIDASQTVRPQWLSAVGRLRHFYKAVRFGEVDCHEDPEICENHNVDETPTILALLPSIND